jgi:GNAT superfamily N-acetyltransferase
MRNMGIWLTTDVATDEHEHEPQRMACSLLPECVVEPGGSRDYKLLAPYHYRNTGYPPAVHQVYRARHVPSGRVVGAIVYAAPALNLGIRNKIFGDDYKIGGGGCGLNHIRSARLNRDFELIIRVVVHPTFRGIGLGHRLISETLPLRPYRYVEMSAAMGSINPFAETAGMRAIQVPRPDNTERVLAALRSAGVADAQIANPREMMLFLESCPESQRRFLESELHRYALRWIKSRTKRDVKMNTRIAVDRLAMNALLQNVYYLWENPAAASNSDGGADHGQRELQPDCGVG